MISSIRFVILDHLYALLTRLRLTSGALWLRLIGFPLVALIVYGVVAALTGSARTHFALPALIKMPVSAPASGKQTPAKVEAELITLTPSGFEPTEIERPQGRFLLAVDNRSGIREITLRLDREAGDRLHEVRLPPGKLDWRIWADLPPGRYILTEADHPEWTCSITIIAR